MSAVNDYVEVYEAIYRAHGLGQSLIRRLESTYHCEAALSKYQYLSLIEHAIERVDGSDYFDGVLDALDASHE